MRELLLYMGGVCKWPVYNTDEAGHGTHVVEYFDVWDCAGFFGEVNYRDFISNGDLTNQLGVTQGTQQNLDVNWLKFWIDGKIVFIAKKTLRHSITFEHLLSLDLISGDRVVTIGDYSYRVRCIEGLSPTIEPPVTEWTGDNITISIDSEWNRLLYRIAVDLPAYPKDNQKGEDWLLYPQDNSANGLNLSAGYGTYSWCKETLDSTTAIRRGERVTMTSTDSTSRIATANGWRPVLELVR